MWRNTSRSGLPGSVLAVLILASLLTEKASRRCKEIQEFVKSVAGAREENSIEKAENMTPLHLTFACEDYDRTRPVKDGIVKPEGIELNYLVMSVEEIFWRMMKYEEFDVSELSMGAFLTAAAQGRRPFIAIPVFPSRTFRHRCIFVNTAYVEEEVAREGGALGAWRSTHRRCRRRTHRSRTPRSLSASAARPSPRRRSRPRGSRSRRGRGASAAATSEDGEDQQHERRRVENVRRRDLVPEEGEGAHVR